MPALSPFDILAQTYDAAFTTSNTGRLQRNRVWEFLIPLLNAAGRQIKILEINCGTGEDAVHMANLGHRVMATDASAMMIAKAKEKINASANCTNIDFAVCAFDQLSTVFANEKFDLIFSNFGGLNCCSKMQLGQLSKDLALLLNPGGYLFFVLLSPYCLREMLHFGIRGKLKTAFRRFKSPVNFTVKGESIPVYYYSPHKLKKIFSPLFKLNKTYPVGLFIPPSYLEKKYELHINRLNQLNKLEHTWGLPAFSLFGDHYCAIFNYTKTNA